MKAFVHFARIANRVELLLVITDVLMDTGDYIAMKLAAHIVSDYVHKHLGIVPTAIKKPKVYPARTNATARVCSVNVIQNLAIVHKDVTITILDESAITFAVKTVI